MVGRVGTSLGEHGINISAAAVGRQEGDASDLAVMAVTTDVRVPDEVVAQIAASDGFVSGRSLTPARHRRGRGRLAAGCGLHVEPQPGLAREAQRLGARARGSRARRRAARPTARRASRAASSSSVNASVLVDARQR